MSVETEPVLDEQAMLGEESHYVCCVFQYKPTPTMSMCGLDMTGDRYEPAGAATCARCIELSETTILCPATGGNCPYEE